MLNLKNKRIFSIIILICFILGINYFKPIQVYDLIKPYNSEILPKKINSYIYFSSYSDKDFEVRGQDSIKKIITLLGNIKVRKVLTTPNPYTPKLKSTYRFFFISENNKTESIYILNNEYIEINHKGYQIIGMPELSKIYELIILDQEEGSLDKFYYDLIDKNV